MQKNSISIIIPCYNQEYYLKQNIPIIQQFFKNQNIQNEIIIVDDGSTPKIKHIKNTTLIRNQKNKGKGYSLKKGIKRAKKDYILITDSDLATPIEEFIKLKQYHKKYGAIIGSRNLNTSKTNNKNKFRITFGITFTKLVNILFNLKIKDTQCGFKLFKTSAIKKAIYKSKINGFSFDVELLNILHNQNVKIKEVGIIWKSKKNSKVNLFKHPILMFVELLKIKYNQLNKKY